MKNTHKCKIKTFQKYKTDIIRGWIFLSFIDYSLLKRLKIDVGTHCGYAFDLVWPVRSLKCTSDINITFLF